MPANDPLTRALDDGAIPYHVVNGRAVVDPEIIAALHRSAFTPKETHMSLASYTSNTIQATVAPGAEFVQTVSGETIRWTGGTVVTVSIKDYPALQLAGILL